MGYHRKVTSAWNYFDHVFCVNLDRRPDRWAEAQAELQLCGVSTCERLSAVDRRGMFGGGAAGCGASHRVIWRRVAAGECGDRVLIFEDDFMLTTRKTLLRAGYKPEREEVKIFDSLPGQTVEARLAAILSYVPASWDLLYLGGGYQTEPIARLNKYLIRNGGMLTTHAYAITRKMAKLVTEQLDAGYGSGTESNPNVHSGASDTVLAALSKQDDVFSYTMTPRMFIQRPTTQSDLDPKSPGFPWDQVDSRHELMV
jgi:GR25 family glycosyltransferase involved in LPS biosynthesis